MRWRTYFPFEGVVLLNNHLHHHHHCIVIAMNSNSVHSVHLSVSELGVTVEWWYKRIFPMHQRMWAITWKWDAKGKYLGIQFQLRWQIVCVFCHQELNKWKLWNYFILFSDYLQLDIYLECSVEEISIWKYTLDTVFILVFTSVFTVK